MLALLGGEVSKVLRGTLQDFHLLERSLHPMVVILLLLMMPLLALAEREVLVFVVASADTTRRRGLGRIASTGFDILHRA